MSTANLVSSVQALEAEKAEILARLETLKAGKAKKVTKEETVAIDEQRSKWSSVRKRREKIVGEMWKLIEDVLEGPEKKAEIRESLCLDE
jgi:26S proteasome regulatory subunit (ATPase 3-interacting protein)